MQFPATSAIVSSTCTTAGQWSHRRVTNSNANSNCVVCTVISRWQSSHLNVASLPMWWSGNVWTVWRTQPDTGTGKLCCRRGISEMIISVYDGWCRITFADYCPVVNRTGCVSVWTYGITILWATFNCKRVLWTDTRCWNDNISHSIHSQ